MNKFTRLFELKRILESSSNRTEEQNELLEELTEILKPYHEQKDFALSMGGKRCPACGRAL
ncbi:hypothetical protein [Vallitalea guaymasensis]|uniref:hypothetical protein n=1 Tax=Vallitalea guaymasensis TaxID=1185412 RepID=UPI002357D9EC|nr:hypothetical protein [Vallitalea guaymasensis]